MKILVTGGTGRVGSEVVKELQKRKADIRLLVRKNEASTPAGVEAVIGDLLDPVSVAKAMAGVDKLYLLNAVERNGGGFGDNDRLATPKSVAIVPHFASKLAMEVNPAKSQGCVAERVGFEPTVEFPQHTLSKRAP